MRRCIRGFGGRRCLGSSRGRGRGRWTVRRFSSTWLWLLLTHPRFRLRNLSGGRERTLMAISWCRWMRRWGTFLIRSIPSEFPAIRWWFLRRTMVVRRRPISVSCGALDMIRVPVSVVIRPICSRVVIGCRSWSDGLLRCRPVRCVLGWWVSSIYWRPWPIFWGNVCRRVRPRIV